MHRNREIARRRLHSRMLQLDLGYGGSHKSLLESQAKLHRAISPSLETALEESRNIASQIVWDGFQNTSPPASSIDMTGIDRSDSSLRVSQQDTMKEISPLKKPLHIDHTQPTLLCYSGFVKSTQEIDYLAVTDFESTCDQPVNLQPAEIIEFPAVLVNLNMQKLEGSFRTYVRPDCHPQLSQFCKLLTGIQQAEVCVQWVPFNLRPYCNHFCVFFFHWFLLNISCDITAEISCTMECFQYFEDWGIASQKPVWHHDFLQESCTVKIYVRNIMPICGAITLRSVQSIGCTSHTCQAERSPLTTITDFLPTCLSDYHNNVLDWVYPSNFLVLDRQGS